ncbi:MAG TPA: CoA pyrophosphatase [Desulfobacteraceae bacterium]|nr:CoA pyrophosphatase [Deltaproteobacteria bacterium]MBW2356569.1 CoA pyrophosphatase [Deltaproteobacteria bacterium]HDI61023.1 CoA pyrophosphatase [Desulfobacteraceae bacterium]
MEISLDPRVLKSVVAAPCTAPSPTPGFQPASVSLLIFEKGDPHLLAIQKTDTEGYPWRNQVALPGGHQDAEDPSAMATALRELEEELGIPPAQVDMLGSLGRFQTIAMREVEAFVGIWDGTGPVRYEAAEIARVLEIPLPLLVAIHLERRYRGRLPDLRELVYPYRDVVIWGLTAKIVHCFIERLLPTFEASRRQGTAS